MKLPRPPFAGALLTLAALSPADASAQSAASVPASPEEETLVLSPFEVNTARDVGYLAGDTMLGGRLNAALRDTPASISVVTREFLDDLGVYNFTDAAAWVPNVVSQYEATGENQFNDYNARFRNLSNNAQSRNFFEWFVNADSYNTERIDFSRGPNSVVFGTADIGGVGNISTKQAGPRRRYQVAFLTSNFGGYRSTVDVNHPLTKSWFIRLNAVSEDLDGWRDFERRRREGLHLATKLNLGQKLSLRAEYEYGDINRVVVGRGVFNAFDGWDRTTFVDAPRTSGSFGGGINRRTSDYLYFAPGSGAGMLNERNLGVTSDGGILAQMLTRPRTDTGWRSDVTIPSHRYNFFAPNYEAKNPYHTYTVFANATPIENLFLEAAFNVQQQERMVDQLVWQAISVDVNRVRADGSPNPHAGQFFSDSRARTQNQKNEVEDFRLAAAYQVKTKFTDQNILLLGGRRENTFFLDENEFVRVNGTGALANFSNAQNRVMVRRYESLRQFGWAPPPVDPSIARWVRFRERTSTSEVTYFQAAVVGKWFSDRRLSTTAGLRRDRTGGGQRDNITDPVTTEVLGLGPYTVNESRSFTTKSIGAVYRLKDWVSVYGGYAESFRPAGINRDINGAELDPEVNEGLEGGLRFSFFDGTLNASAAYYVNEKTNKRESGAAGDINAIWEEINRPERLPADYRDTSSDKGEGFEFEIVGRPRRGWNITANLALPEAFQTAGLRATQAYYNTHIAAWRDGATAQPDIIIRERIEQNIRDVEDRLARFPEGRTLLDSFKYTANIFTTYRFQEGRLKGAWVGGGVNFRGERLEAVDQDGEYWEPGYELVTATVGYQGRWRRVGYRVQLNVTNLLDREIVRASQYSAFTASGNRLFLPRNFIVMEPRRIQLTTSFTF